MKNIAIIQRVEFIKKRNEFCDALDQRWTDLLLSINLFPIFLPNNISYVKKFIKTREINGLLISGGGSLVKYNGSSPERDEIEKILINFSIKKNIPVLGVCRGMQSIQNHFDNNIQTIKNHVNKRHPLNVVDNTKIGKILKQYDEVNSFHEYGSIKTNKDIITLAISNDGIIEAIRHIDKEIYGIMWHPERENPFNKLDKSFLKMIFGR